MTPEEITKAKNNTVLGVAMTVPIYVTKKTVNTVTQLEETIEEDSTENIILRPIQIKFWSELEGLDVFKIDKYLVARTARKPVEWCDEVLNPSCWDELLEKCKEINAAFFLRQVRLLEKIEENMERDIKIAEAVQRKTDILKKSQEPILNPLASASQV